MNRTHTRSSERLTGWVLGWMPLGDRRNNVALTDAEKATANTLAHKEIHAAKSVKDLVPLWRKHMGILGHKACGRLLLDSVNPDGTKKDAAKSG